MKNSIYMPPLLVFSEDYSVKKRLMARELANDYKATKVPTDLPIYFEKKGLTGRGDRVEIRTIVANKRLNEKPLEECPPVEIIEVLRKPFESYTKFIRRVFNTVLENDIDRGKVMFDTPPPKPLQFSHD